MIFSRAWFALMRRNLIYRRRNWVGTILEIMLPVAFVGVLVAIKSAVEGTSGFDSETIPPYMPKEKDMISPLTFTDYVTAMRVKRECVIQDGYKYITGFDWNWPIPMLKCDADACQENGEDATGYCEFNIVALAGADGAGEQRAQDMKDWLEKRYPSLVNGDIKAKHPIVQIFKDSADLSNYVRRDDYGREGVPKMAMGIIWEEGNDEMNYLYALRQNSTNFNNPENEGRPGVGTTPETDTLFDRYAKRDEACVPLDGAADQGRFELSCTGQYMYNGVLTFQRLVGDFILADTKAAEKGYKVADAGVSYIPFPSPEYEEEGFYEAISGFAPLLIVLGILYPVAAMISYVCSEKELRQKELMKMMSVSESDIGWAWFCTFFLVHIFTTIFTTLMTTSLYENSDGIYMFLFWLFTFISVITFTMTLATLTSKATRGILIGLLVFFIGFFVSLAVDSEDASSSIIGLVSLHPVAAFSYGIQEIGRLEDQGVGVTADSVDQTDSSSGYTFQTCLGNLVFDCFFWGVLSWYLNRVIAPEYGQAYPPYFPFTASYWCPGRAVPEEIQDDPSVLENEVPLEPVGEALRRQSQEGENIEIRKLSKVFGEKAAVNELNLNMYKGEITALLGHNGAGKTTTISMLTGALAPTSGYAKVAGKDIRTQMGAIRQDIGICLQHDCLFPNLTVREHVQFFSRLKGLYSKVSRSEAEKNVDEAIRDVALFEKRNTLSKNLSGGMKRKLSVAMAFCGGSKVVLLDEPTSGMDPFARRFTWNVIRQYRRDRCIILTTHFMDEADILGDRIAIMAEGQLRCAGSSLFLKKTYGVGYQLTIEKIKGEHGNTDKAQSDQNVGNDSALMEIVESAVPKANLLTNVGSELSYQLPMASSSEFPTMFEGLDSQVDQGNVSSYGVSITTLDEVFLLVARGDGSAEKKEFASSRRASGLNVEDAQKSVRSRMDLENEGLFTRHVGALFRKRAAFFRRDKKAWCCTTFIPSLFVLVGFLLYKFIDIGRNQDPLALDLNSYNTKGGNPRNPTAYNTPESFYECQPKNCPYEEFIDDEITGEAYYYCGTEASLSSSSASCSISESRNIIENINDAGTVAQGFDVENVTESSESLFDSTSAFTSIQYGAFWFTHDQNSVVSETSELYNASTYASCLASAQESEFVSEEECDRFGGIGVVIQYNFTALHVSPLYQMLADEALVREALNEPDFNIECTIAPLPITKKEDSFGEAEDAFNAWFLVILSFPFIGGAFASFIVTERESKAKHLQSVAGVEPSAYWISTFLWDTMNYQIPLWITVALMFIFDVNVLTTTTGNILSGVVAVLFFYGPASAGFAYCASFAFTSPSMCNVTLIISGFLIGMGGPLAVFILRLIGEGDEKQNLVDTADTVAWVLRVFFPAFNLGNGLFNAINIETFRAIEQDPNISAWDSAILLYEVILLIVQSVVYLCFAVVLDISSTNPNVMSVFNKVINIVTFQCLCKSDQGIDITVALPEDDDVIEEQERVLSGGANDDLIVVNQLSKVYDTGKVAVNNMSLGIPHGECFGLLGINGAGKTTTMGMLTAEFPPTHGDATLAGYSVRNEPRKTRRRIGYCPQFDAHFANLTGREHVELYASIKGVPLDIVKEAAAAKLKEVGLSDEDSDRLSAGYSGGMKRRLSLACATIGQPQILFLDECSTGVDPVARREIWQLISDMVAGDNLPENEKTSVILTTHSMEECEALCPRIGIMANGRLRCLGSAQHLKNKFGQGYQVELKVKVLDKGDEDYVENMQSLASEMGGDEVDPSTTMFSLNEALSALRNLSGDEFLSAMVNEENASGYPVWKDASSPVGVPLDTLAAFATAELRMRRVDLFIKDKYPNHVLRERQDSKARYEVGSEGVRISSLFTNVEENKERLRLSDYGVSQTSLEQVFNMHAAEAERLKQGRNDG